MGCYRVYDTVRSAVEDGKLAYFGVDVSFVVCSVVVVLGALRCYSYCSFCCTYVV